MPRPDRHGQMRQELLDFGGPHVPRVALAKMPDKSFNPIQICLLGTEAVMFEANPAPNLIQQTGRGGRLVLRRYGINFLGSTKNVQPTDEYQLSTNAVVLYSLLDWKKNYRPRSLILKLVRHLGLSWLAGYLRQSAAKQKRER
jgi:hypothetical protein